MKTSRIIKKLIYGYLSKAYFLHVHFNLPDWILFPLFCRFKSKCPDDLTIVLLHNYDSDPLTVRCLKHVGIDHVVLKVNHKGDWHHSIKIRELYKYLTKCKTRYVLYLDSVDVLVRHPIEDIIQLLKENYYGKREILFSFTNSGLCAGVFMGETEMIKDLIGVAYHRFVRDHVWKNKEEWYKYRDHVLENRWELFPMKFDDQRIFRHIQENKHGIKLDIERKLAYR